MLRTGDQALVEVVLQEEDAPSEPSGPAPGAGRRSSDRRTRRRLWWPAVGAAVIAVVLVDVVGDRRERQEIERYADVPGVVVPLVDPVEARWTVPSAVGAWGHRGTVVSVEPRAGVVGRDSGTGDVRWSIPVPTGSDVSSAGCLLTAPSDTGATTAVCRPPEPPGASDVPGSRADLQVLDTSDGRVIRTMPSPPELVGAAAVRDDLVLVERTAAGVVVHRQDLVTGEEAWRTDVEGIAWPGPTPDVYVTGEVVVVEGTTTAVLAARDGDVLGTWEAPDDGSSRPAMRVVGLPRAGFGVWTSAGRGRWYGVDGEPGPALSGVFAGPSVADGSPPGVLLLESSDGRHLSAVDVGSGARLWRRAAPGRVLLSLGGRLVTLSDNRMLRGLDAATGDQLWSARLDGGHEFPAGPPFTDGVRVLVAGRTPDGDPRLTAYRIADGEQLWATGLPEGTDYVSVLGEHLVAVDHDPSIGSRGGRLVVLG